MKALLVAIGLIMGFSAFAETPVVYSKQVTCQEFKNTIENYGSAIVKSKFIFWSSFEVFNKKEDLKCRAGHERVSGVFRTSDVTNCQVGYFCVIRDRADHDPCRLRRCNN